jgi:HAD superfamily hydrolase (TIGR01549 family)
MARFTVISVDIGNTLVVADGPSLPARLADLVNMSQRSRARRQLFNYLHSRPVNRRELTSLCQRLDVSPAMVVTHAAPKRYPLPGAMAMLEKLQGMCTRLVTMSNVCSVDAVALPDQLERFISRHYYSYELGVAKPAAAAFTAILRSEGIGPDEAVHVGDDLRKDVLGAANVGIGAVWLSNDSRLAVPATCCRAPDLESIPAAIELLATRKEVRRRHR